MTQSVSATEAVHPHSGTYNEREWVEEAVEEGYLSIEKHEVGIGEATDEIISHSIFGGTGESEKHFRLKQRSAQYLVQECGVDARHVGQEVEYYAALADVAAVPEGLFVECGDVSPEKVLRAFGICKRRRSGLVQHSPPAVEELILVPYGQDDNRLAVYVTTLENPPEKTSDYDPDRSRVVRDNA